MAANDSDTPSEDELGQMSPYEKEAEYFRQRHRDRGYYMQETDEDDSDCAAVTTWEEQFAREEALRKMNIKRRLPTPSATVTSDTSTPRASARVPATLAAPSPSQASTSTRQQLPSPSPVPSSTSTASSSQVQPESPATPSGLRYVQSNRGKQMLEHKGFLYRFRSEYKGSKYYQCYKQTCNASIVIRPSKPDEPEIKRGHGHDPSPVPGKQRELASMLKAKAVKHPERRRAVVYEETMARINLTGLSAAEKSQVTKTAAHYEERISKARQKNPTLPPRPPSVDQIVLTDRFTKIVLDDETFDFLISDGQVEGKRVLIFGVHDLLIYLHQTHQFDPSGQSPVERARIFADGTFFAAPEFFYQVYTIHAYIGSKLFPLVMALLPGKSRAIYEYMLTQIREMLESKFVNENGQGLTWNPQSFQIDFERAMKKALRNVLPNTDVKGCLFHFRQAIIRHVTELKLMKQYNDPGSEAGRIIRKLLTLPLLPPENVEWALQQFIESSNEIEEEQQQQLGVESLANRLNALLDYVKMTWVGSTNDNIRPKFAISWWNHFGEFQDRTNNRVEGYFRDLNARAPKANCSVYEFLDRMKIRAASDVRTVTSILSGTQPRNRIRKEDRDKNERLRAFIHKLENEPNYFIINFINDLMTINW